MFERVGHCAIDNTKGGLNKVAAAASLYFESAYPIVNSNEVEVAVQKQIMMMLSMDEVRE